MNCMSAIKKYFTYLSFKGRSTRSEYWWPLLFNIVVFGVFYLIVLAIIAGYIPEDINTMSDIDRNELQITISNSTPITILDLVSIFFYFCTLVCSICLNVRRIHDLNHSGWMLLLLLVPIVGFIFWIWVSFFRGTKGPNAYGPDPLESVSSDTKAG